jgi:solute:Na+ symporter, SSS family
MQIAWIDLAILASFVFYSVTTGFILRKKASRGLEEYFLAGRTLKGWQSGISMAATQYAADTPLLVTGLIATSGIFALWRLWVYALAFLLMGFVLGACWRRAGVLTDAEFTELRYSGKGASVLRVLKAVYMGTVINCTVLAMVLIAAARIAEPFLIWHEWLPLGVIQPLAYLLEQGHVQLSVLSSSHPNVWLHSADNLISIGLIVGFTTLYSATGGLRSVVATDVVQFAIAMIATFMYAWVLIQETGGFGLIREKLTLLYGTASAHSLLSFGPTAFDDVAVLFIAVLTVQWFAQVNADGTGYLAQRTMGCATDRDAKLAAVLFVGAQILIRSLIWILIGLALLVLYPAEELSVLSQGAGEHFRVERESTFVWGIRDFLPAGVRGLMLTGMLAALASTVDTHLNWGASYWTNDIYKRFAAPLILKRKPTSRELVWVARFSNFIILGVALFIMARLDSIQSAWHLSLLFGSGVGTVLILRWLWHRINLWSEIAAAGASLIFAPILLFGFPNLSEGERLLLMTALSTVAVLFVTFATPPEPLKKRIEFYQKVKPPGFWTDVAEAGGENRQVPMKRFARSLGATVLSALSVFLLLISLGGFLVEGFDSNLPVNLTVLLTGLIIVPVWWRLGFR